MRNPDARAQRSTNAILIYLIVLVSFQVFLVMVAVEAFSTGTKALAWSAAIVSAVIAVGAGLLGRSLRH